MPSELIGKTACIIIDEPRTFTTLSGGNHFLVTIDKEVIDKKRVKYSLASVQKPFMWKGHLVNQILFTPRHDGYYLSQLLNNKKLIVNIYDVVDQESLLNATYVTRECIRPVGMGAVFLGKTGIIGIQEKPEAS